MPDFLKVAAALLNIGFGAVALYRPEEIAEFTGFKLIGVKGVTELRVAFGGFFMGMGVGVLLLNDPAAYQAIGFAWLGAAFVRLMEYIFNGRDEQLATPGFYTIWAIEALVGLIFIL